MWLSEVWPQQQRADCPRVTHTWGLSKTDAQRRRLQAFPVKGQKVNVLGYTGYRAAFKTTGFYCCHSKAGKGNTEWMAVAVFK